MRLTERQKSICDLIVLGWTSKEIARALGIQLKTVEVHRTEIFKRAGVRNAVELVRILLSGKEVDAHG